MARSTRNRVAPNAARRPRDSRDRIVQATVTSLADRGLANTSTLKVQEDAQVSRGSLLHHFPSKATLLVAAVRQLAVDRFSAATSEPPASTDGQRIDEAIDLLWSMYDGPLFWAAIELWIGARQDGTLRDILEVEERKLGHVVDEMCDELFGPQIAALPDYSDFRDVLITSMRGIALTYSFDKREMSSESLLRK